MSLYVPIRDEKSISVILNTNLGELFKKFNQLLFEYAYPTSFYADSSSGGGSSPMAFSIVEPSCAGDLEIIAPAASKASNLAAAVPLPPLTMAPACPIRRPGGAINRVSSRNYR